LLLSVTPYGSGTTSQDSVGSPQKIQGSTTLAKISADLKLVWVQTRALAAAASAPTSDEHGGTSVLLQDVPAQATSAAKNARLTGVRKRTAHYDEHGNPTALLEIETQDSAIGLVSDRQGNSIALTHAGGAPSADDQTLIEGAESWIQSFAPDGQLNWARRIAPDSASALVPADPHPVVDALGTSYIVQAVPYQDALLQQLVIHRINATGDRCGVTSVKYSWPIDQPLITLLVGTNPQDLYFSSSASIGRLSP
jgi:hypothetical protein